MGTFVIGLARKSGIERLITTTSRTYLIKELGLTTDQIVDYRSADFVAKSLAIIAVIAATGTAAA